MPPPNRHLPQAHPSFSGLRALVADQHASVRIWLREQLSTLGMVSIAMAGSAVDLVRQLKNAALPFDVILCDHQLDPRCDGLQLLEELRYEKILPLVTIFLIVTGERLYPRVVAAAEFAPDDYLIKPFSPSLLEERLNVALLRKRHLRHAHERIERGELENALEACDQALKSSKLFLSDTLRLKAEVLVSLGRLEDAASLYSLIAERRMIPWARMGYAMTLHRQGRSAEAERIASELNTEHPEFLSVYDFMASLKEAKGELAEAARYLERAAGIAASTARLRHLADIAEAQGNHAQARSALQRVVERTRQGPMLEVSDYIKLLRVSQGDALETAQIAIDMRRDLGGSDCVENRIALAVADALTARQSQRNEEAVRHIDAALALRSGSATELSAALTLELASACLDTGREDQAERLAGELVRQGAARGAALDAMRARLAAIRERRAQRPPVPSEASDQRVDATTAATELTLAALTTSWDDELARECRGLLAMIFSASPRDRRVIECHIRYNKLAAANGAQHHRPGTLPS